MRAHPHTGAAAREDGFTLIELVVGALLLMIVIGMMVYSVTRLLGSRDDLTADRGAQRQALDAMEQLRHDVAAARSPALGQYDGRRDELRDVIYFWNDRANDPDSLSRQLCGGATGDPYLRCLRDVTVATPSELWFRADVDTQHDGAECIGYGVQGTRFIRWQSNDWRGCGSNSKGGARVTTLVTAKQMPAAVFTYILRYNPTMVPNQPADADDCQTFAGGQAQARINGHPRGPNLINNVELDLSGIATRRDAASIAAMRTSFPLNGRTAGDYAYAMGCSFL